jgi:hypothetical protein
MLKIRAQWSNFFDDALNVGGMYGIQLKVLYKVFMQNGKRKV